MENRSEKAKSLMEKGWKAREAHDFERSEKLLISAKKEFEELGDWFNVTECLNHLAYLHKSLALKEGQEGLELARESLRVAKEKGTKTASVFRALLSLLDSAGNFEEAKLYVKELMEKVKNVAVRGDAKSHLAKFTLRSGDKVNAKVLIEEAIKDINEGWELERMPHKAIWLTGALMTKALINFNSGNLKEAKKDLEKAEEFAKQSESKSRIYQVSELKRFLSSQS